MNKLRVIVSLFLVGLLCGIAIGQEKPADNPPPAKDAEKTSEKPPEKKTHKLGGEFKGHPVETAPVSESASTAKEKEKASVPAGAPGAAAKTPAPAPKIVIDNTMVKSGAPPEKEKSAKSASPPPSAPPAAPPVSYSPPVDLNGHDEAYWKQKAAATRQRAAEAERALEAARQEEKREENDFYAWDDGQYRDNVIKPAWDKAREETAKAEQELKDAQEALGNLEDDARKAGALPGWIRE